MALRNIVKVGDDVLRKKCRPVTMIDPKIHQLLDDMAQTMHEDQWRGLAAPQVGLLKRIVVIDIGEGCDRADQPGDHLRIRLPRPTMKAACPCRANTCP